MKKTYKNRSSNSGFTLIELIVTLTVAGVLLTIGIPQMRDLIKNNRLTTHTNDLVADLNFARLEAIKLNRSVFITATNASDASNEFGPGWTTWTDTDSDGVMDSNERLRIKQALDGNVTVDGSLNPIEFQANGALNSLATVNFDLCDDRTAENGRRISIAPIGRVSSAGRSCP